MVYTPGAKVQNNWNTSSAGAVDDKSNTVAGSFACDEELQPAKNSTGYTVTFTPSNTNWYTPTSGTIKKDVAKANQIITWSLVAGKEYSTGEAELDAAATSGGEINYSSSNESYAKIVDGQLYVVTPNVPVKITATQVGNDNWNSVDSTRTIITRGATPKDFSGVSARTIGYGQLLRESEIDGKVKVNGVEIDGKIEWIEPLTLPNAGNHTFGVRFTPSAENAAAYNSIDTSLNVTVNKATAELRWNISNALREKTKYSNFVTSSNTSSELQISIPDDSQDFLDFTDGVLTTGAITQPAEGKKNPVDGKKIHVLQTVSDTANYNPIDLDYVVTIYPKSDQCIPVNISVADDTTKIQNMGASYVGSHEWCNSTGRVDTEYSVSIPLLSLFKIPVHYTQFKGIQLGKWNEGLGKLQQVIDNFSFFDGGVKALYNDIISAFNAGLPGNTKSIELAFTGVPETLSFDTKLQTVTFELGSDTTARQKDPKWYVYQKSINGIENVIDSFPAYTTESIQVQLDSTTRSVIIELNSAFAGFIQNLNITQKQYIRAEETPAEFGNGNPLQAPQKLKISYSSIGSCDIHYDTILVSTDTSAFYVDKGMIISNVGLDHMGVDSVFVRCNDVGQTGNVIFKAKNTGVELKVPVSSATPVITSDANTIFQTGTEHAPEANSDYRALRMHDFSNCFNGGEARFDYLYVFGVSESSASDRQWEYDAHKGYKVPVVTTSNVHTPCFVYKKKDNNYEYTRTFDAAAIALEINGSKNGFVGYKPAGPSIQVSGNAGIYLDSVEMKAANAVFAINGTGTIHARGINKLTSSANAAIQLAASAKLDIEDSWTGEATSAKLALIPATNYPSISLGNANNTVTINGTQLELHNAKKKAIAHMSGTTELEDGEVIINDGSIYGADTLGMPLNTYINGGTFNQGTVQCYTNKGTARRPWNSNGDLVVRKTMTFDALPVGYGKSHLTLDANKKVNPMLLDEELCIFYGNKDKNPSNEDNWNKVPDTTNLTSEVLIKAHMVIEKKELAFKMMALAGGDTVSVTVKSDAGLKIGKGGLIGSTPKNFTLAADSTGKTGHLRISPEYKDEMPEVTIQLLRLGYTNGSITEGSFKMSGNSTWQYVGCPVVKEGKLVKRVVGGWINSWDEKSGAWVNTKASLVVTPFDGFANSQSDNPNGAINPFKGKLIDNSVDYNMPLTCGTSEMAGWNLLANSFAAPIDIKALLEDNDEKDIDKTIYLFNTGNTKAVKGDAGTYTTITNATIDAGETQGVIPSMQGFFVKARKDCQFTFNYANTVWAATYEDNNGNTQMRVKGRSTNSEKHVVSVLLEANGQRDKLLLIESEDYSTHFENGYDAHIMSVGACNIFAVEDNEYLAVDATNSIIGTHLGVRTGEETAYTMTFSRVDSEAELVLQDSETEQTIDIYEGMEYTFFAAPNSVITDRFQIITIEKAPEIATGVDNTKSGVKIQKFIKDNQLYILKNGVLYNATGVVVSR